VVRPCAFRHLETYQFVTVEDRPFEWDALTTAEKLQYAKRGVNPGSTVYKTVETVAEGEFLRVVHEPRREALIDISDDDIEAEGSRSARSSSSTWPRSTASTSRPSG
jgi:hypothetical protein